MKNSMFLMLVLLCITSQPSIASDALVVGLSALAIVPVVVKVGSKWYTHFQVTQCANMPEGRNKEQSVYDLLSKRSGVDQLIQQGDDQQYAIKIAKKNGLDMNSRGKNDRTPLHLMLDKGDRTMAAHLIKCGANVDCTDQSGITPLCRAISNKNLKMMEWLIGHGANVDCADQYGFTHLGCAIRNNHLEMMEWLIGHGANVDCIDQYGFTPLGCAIGNNHLEMAAYLIKCGANVDCTDQSGITPLCRAISNKNLKMMEWFIGQGANVDCTDQYGFTPLGRAISNNNLEMMEWFISNGADINGTDSLGNTYLGCAVNSDTKNLKMMKWLIGHGADINGTDPFGETYLQAAFKKHTLNKAALLLVHNIKIDNVSIVEMSLSLFYRVHATTHNIDEREYLQNQFEIDLKKDELRERKKKWSNLIERLFTRELPTDIAREISVFLMGKFSDKDCLRIAAQQYLKKIDSQTT